VTSPRKSAVSPVTRRNTTTIATAQGRRQRARRSGGP
jgi:hypothetical protein